MAPTVFAIPGDITTRTGGYIYERRLLGALREEGRDVRHLALPGSFPDPTPADMAASFRALGEVASSTPLILDGFLSGALDTDGLARLRAPLCAVVHHPLGLESGLTPERAAFLIAREQANLALMRHVLVPSPHTATTLSRDFGVAADKITVVPPGFDPVADVGHRVRPPLILSVGILHPRKGHDVLVEALARIADLDWNAVIVGGTHDAAYARALRSRIVAPDLAGRVRLAGELDDPDLETLYRSATLLALATRYEGYGMVFGEAQQHGLPIVSCRTGAVADTVPAGAGLLVPPDDAEAFAAALREVLEDDTLWARLADGSAAAGRTLPTWADAARLAGGVLDRIATG